MKFQQNQSVLSTIFEFTKLGDPLVVKLSKSLLQHSIQPFLQCLQVWLIEGKLTDNYQEFFVEPGQALEANRAEYRVVLTKYQKKLENGRK